MKMRTRMLMAAHLCLCAAPLLAADPAAKPAAAGTRIGIYDSRAIAVAYVDSAIFKASEGVQLDAMQVEYDKAKAAGDQHRVAELKAQGQARQTLLHTQGFSTASVRNILDQIKDKLPAIQAQAGVTALVSKWDQAALATYPDAERVDVTMALVDAFNPTPRQRQSAIAIQKSTPISLKQAGSIRD